MHCNISYDNSYCYVESNDIYKLIPIIEKVSSYRQTYFIKKKYSKDKRPERKSRLLTFYEFKENKIIFPRGWVFRVYDELTRYNVTVSFNDLRPELELHPQELKDLELFDYQREAVEKGLEYRYGIMSHIMGSGKTIIAIGLISKIGPPGMVMVPANKMLMYQFKEAINKHLPNLKVGIVGDSKLEEGDILVGTSVSFYLKRKELQDFYKGPLQFLILDEAHKIREGNFDLKNQYFYVSLSVNANFKIALTATPGDPGTLKRMLLEGVTGGIIHKIDYEKALDYGIIVPMKVYVFKLPLMQYKKLEFHKDYEINLLDNTYLYKKIIELVEILKEKSIPTLIICDRVGKQLKKLEEMIPDAKVLFGETSSEEREEVKKEFELGKVRVLISTLIKEGINIKNIQAIILAGGGKDSDVLLQKYGRGLRSKQGKSQLILFDFKYDNVGKGVQSIMHKHSLNRIKTYKKQKVEVVEVNNVEDISWD